MPAMRAILLSCAMLALPACTFVKMAPGAQQVKVLSAAPTGCERRGDVAVSITHRVGFYERDDTRVRDELELLARNEAPGLGGNAVQPLDGPEDGRQRYAVWRCRS